MDIREICLDEIALEGLDGITLPALWLRLENYEPPVKINDKMKEYVWGFIVQHESLQCYQLTKDRLEPQIFDRFVGHDTGWIPNAKAPDELDTLREVYSSNPMSDGPSGIRGSCSDYEQRVYVSDEISAGGMTLQDAIKNYGLRKLAIVASQSLRERSLLQNTINPKVIAELGDVAYAVLERLGRSRWQGDLQAVLNKKVFTEKSYHIHYVMNKLFKLGLVVKHQYTYRREDKNNRAFFQVLIHLARFGRDCRSSMVRTMDTMRKTLQQCPNLTMNLGQLRELMKMDDRHFKTLYNSMVKNGMGVVEKIDPTKGAKTIYGKTIKLVKKKFDEADDEDEDDDLMGMFSGISEDEVNPIILEHPIIHQSFSYLLRQGEGGVTQHEMLQFLKGYGKLEARNVCRSFDRHGLISTILVDRGRQRSQTYIAKNFAKLNTSTQEFKAEKKKMRQLLAESTLLGITQNDSTAVASNGAEANVVDPVLEMAQTISQESRNEETPMDESVFDASSVSSAATTSVVACDFHPDTCSTPQPNYWIDSSLKSNLPYKKWDANLTTRKIKRHNTILKTLNQEKVIEGCSSLQKILAQKEEEEGLKSKIDKKTVKRLISKMHADGFLQHHVIPITHDGKSRDFDFMVSLDCSPQRLRSAIDTAKFKMLSEVENNKAKSLKKPKKARRRNTEKSDQDSNPFSADLIDYSVPEIGEAGTGLVAGRYQPKFKRLRIIHKFLYYLVNEHPGLRGPAEDAGDDGARDTIDLDKVHVYNDEFTWKRFLPPVPVHSHGGQKWLQVGDVAVVLPISIFCQFHRIGYVVKGLEGWLAHAEQRFCLLRHLPAEMRSLLLYKRKYIYSLMGCIEQLAFMGLLSMRKSGSHNPNTMPKENMMIYVHRKAAIYDTRASCNAHFKVEDKDYEKIEFDLENSNDVDSYWYKLQDVCVKTPIGCANLQDAEYVNMKDHIGTLALKKFVNDWFEKKPQILDNGNMPGDHRGAGGLDSSMYSYLLRNWTLSHRYKSSQPKKPRGARNRAVSSQEKSTEDEVCEISMPSPNDGLEQNMAAIENGHQGEEKDAVAGMDDAPDSSEHRPSQPNIIEVDNIGRNERVRGGKGVKRKTAHVDAEPAKKKQRSFFRKRRLRTRKIKVKRQRLKYHDDRDLAAILSRKGKSRVHFTHAEDSLMLICHIANTIMIRKFWRHKQDPRRSLISWIVIRDIIQHHLPEAMNKTSVSLGRRTRFLMKNQDMRICHDICVTDALSDQKMITETLPTLEEFADVMPDLIPEMYRNLVEKLRAKFQTAPGIFLGEMPDSSDEISHMYSANIVQLRKDRKGDRRQRFDDNVTSVKDITRHVLENVIYVTLTMNDDEFSIYQAFRTFEHFPNDLFTDVFSLMKLSGWVNSKMEARRRMVFGVPSHKLSFGHHASFKANVPQFAMNELWKSVTSSTEIELKMGIDATYGDVFLLCHLVWNRSANMQVDVPQQLILADGPSNSAFENQFLKIAKEAQEELAKGTLAVPGGEYPSSLIAAVSRLSKESLNDDAHSSDEEDKPDGMSNKLAKLLKMYQRHPSYTNWLLLIDPGKRTEQPFASESKFCTLHYAVNADNVALNPCDVRVKNPKELLRHVNNSPRDSSVGLSVISSLESKKFKRAESTSSWEHLRQNAESPERNLMDMIFDEVNKKGIFGSQLSEIETALCNRSPTTHEDVCKVIKKLTRGGALFSVGVQERQYVTYNHVQPWMAIGYQFTGVRSKYQDELSHELLLIERRQVKKLDADVDAVVIVDDGGGVEKYGSEDAMDMDHGGVPQNEIKDGPAQNDMAKNAIKPPDKTPLVWGFRSFNERVLYICRPWHSVCGGINYKTAKQVISSVYLKVLSSPGIPVEKLCACYDFQPICILELVDLLCETGCLVQRTVLHYGPPRLFGGRRRSHEVIYLSATIDGMTKVAEMCNILEERAEQGEGVS